MTLTVMQKKKSNNIDNNIMIILWQPVVTEHIVCARNYIKKSLALSSSHLILTKTSWRRDFCLLFPNEEVELESFCNSPKIIPRNKIDLTVGLKCINKTQKLPLCLFPVLFFVSKTPWPPLCVHLTSQPGFWCVGGIQMVKRVNEWVQPLCRVDADKMAPNH